MANTSLRYQKIILSHFIMTADFHIISLKLYDSLTNNLRSIQQILRPTFGSRPVVWETLLRRTLVVAQSRLSSYMFFIRVCSNKIIFNRRFEIEWSFGVETWSFPCVYRTMNYDSYCRLSFIGVIRVVLCGRTFKIRFKKKKKLKLISDAQ